MLSISLYVHKKFRFYQIKLEQSKNESHSYECLITKKYNNEDLAIQVIQFIHQEMIGRFNGKRNVYLLDKDDVKFVVAFITKFDNQSFFEKFKQLPEQVNQNQSETKKFNELLNLQRKMLGLAIPKDYNNNKKNGPTYSKVIKDKEIAKRRKEVRKELKEANREVEEKAKQLKQERKRRLKEQEKRFSKKSRN